MLEPPIEPGGQTISVKHDVLAREVDGTNREFARTPAETIDPVRSKRHTSRGILNKAWAALGRDPLTDAAADTPMALTATGYVRLGQATATPSAKRAASRDPLGEGSGTRTSIHAGPREQASVGPAGLRQQEQVAANTSQQPASTGIPGSHQRVANVIAICATELRRSMAMASH